MSRSIKMLIAAIAAFALLATQVVPALACGGLVAPNGAIRLARATTLVSWHDGIEHYMTSFSYQGSVTSLGWIVPLPAVPEKIEEGGAWTFQRLFLETHPITNRDVLFESAAVPMAGQSAEVLQQVKVQALDITVLRGSGQAVLDWAEKNGFLIDSFTRGHILVYAQGSPIFMAAKYDTSEAKNRDLSQGDGTPILITMKTPNIWVPIEILALENQKAEADLYLLTDKPINVSDVSAKIGQSPVGSEVPEAPGLKVEYQKKLSPELYQDLSSDRNMSWVQKNSWLTYLTLDAEQKHISYDLGVSTSGIIRLATYGTSPLEVVQKQSGREMPEWLPALPYGTPQFILILWGLLALFVGISWFAKKRANKRANK